MKVQRASELEEYEQLDRADNNIPRAAFAMLFAVDQFVVMFVAHRQRAYRRAQLDSLIPQLGLAPHSESPAGVEAEARRAASALRAGVVSSLWTSLLALAIALGAGYIIGIVDPTLPLHVGKSLLVSGATFILWGTLLAVRGPQGTWGGGSVPERAHRLVYTSLLAAGGSLAMVGTLY